MSQLVDESIIGEALLEEAHEFILPKSIYDIQVPSADGKNPDILGCQKGKVTLLFNVAAGCGNIPQHSVIEELNQLYKNKTDFSIIAITVDDFMCHGYPEFSNGIQEYIDKNNLDKTPGQVAQEYAQKHFGTTYEFSELTNGRHDKHTYDPNFAPGAVKQQEQHELWAYLTRAYEADIQENGVPYHSEEVPWSDVKPPVCSGKKTFMPLTGNFTKFLIDRTGKKVKRYANGFLLGERKICGETFPWYPEKWLENGKRDYRPDTSHREERGEQGNGRFPSPMQRFGIDISLKLISRDIDTYLKQ